LACERPGVQFPPAPLFLCFRRVLNKNERSS